MAPKALDVIRSLLVELEATEGSEGSQRTTDPTVREITGEGLHTVHPCCSRLQISPELRNAVSARIGAPQGDDSIYLLQQLTPSERCDTVDGLLVADAQQPQGTRPPTLYEKTQVRSLLHSPSSTGPRHAKGVVPRCGSL